MPPKKLKVFKKVPLGREINISEVSDEAELVGVQLHWHKLPWTGIAYVMVPHEDPEQVLVTSVTLTDEEVISALEGPINTVQKVLVDDAATPNVLDRAITQSAKQEPTPSAPMG